MQHGISIKEDDLERLSPWSRIAVPLPVCLYFWQTLGRTTRWSFKPSYSWIWRAITFKCMRHWQWVVGTAIRILMRGEVDCWICITRTRYDRFNLPVLSSTNWQIHQTALFSCCAGNELFFIALCLISFSQLPHSACHIGKDHSWSPAFWANSLMCRAWGNPLLVIAGCCFPVMVVKQCINMLQLIKASRWLAGGMLRLENKKGRGSSFER